MENSEKIDAVITYVDNSDPVWLENFLKYCDSSDTPRYRPYGTLPLFVRGIRKFMPFVGKIFLVVSNPEQVPAELGGKVEVVLHKSIIPEKYLPTFNSTTIEMFLHKIPGLSERYVYFNDDMFPVGKLSETDFFRGGKPVYFKMCGDERGTIWTRQIYNSYRLAKRVSGYSADEHGVGGGKYFYVRHSPTPLLKSDCEEIFSAAEKDILYSLTKLREPFNFTQYLFSDYSMMKGNYASGGFPFAFYTVLELDALEEDLKSGKSLAVCVNDADTPDNERTGKRLREILSLKMD